MNSNVADVANANAAVAAPAVEQAAAQHVADQTVAAPDLGEAVTGSQTGFLDKVKEFLDPSTIMERIKSHKDILLAMALYLGAGFLVGFLLKKYFKIVLIIAIPLVALFLLAQFDMLSVVFNWTKLRETFGIQPLPALDTTLLENVWAWTKGNVALALSGAVGFFIGLRLG